MADPDVKRFKAAFIAAPFANLFSTRVLEVSPTRVSIITGLLNKDEHIVPMSKITDVDLFQGFFGSMLGYSNLSLQTAGTDQAEISFISLEHGPEVRDLILKYIGDTER